MTFRISVLLMSFGFLIGPARAESDKSWVRVYESSVLHFPAKDSEWAAATPGRHPRWLQDLLNKVLVWDPQDTTPRLTRECDVTQLTDLLLKAKAPNERTQIFKKYTQNCQKKYAPDVLFGPWQNLKLFTMAYNIDKNPFVHRVVIDLPDGKKIKGLLAIKDNKKRPFIVLRMGITGNIEEAFAERFFYYQLFERGLFHFLMIENMTSTDFIHNNKKLEFAGMAEAYQNIWLAQLLRDKTQPVSKLVQSLHFIGLSLGGQGVLTAAWLAPYQRNKELIQSFLGVCPLVNLDPTFDSLFRKGKIRFPVEIWAHSRFAEVKTFRPDLFKKGFFGLPIRILNASLKNYKKPDAELFKVTEPWFIKNQNDFHSLHELSKWDPTLRKPVWLWVTEQDAIVPANINGLKMENVEPVIVAEGQHCSFPAFWDARVLQALFRSHILSSTSFQYELKSKTFTNISGLEWNLKDVLFPDSESVEVKIQSDLGQDQSFRMGLNDLDFTFRGSKLSDIEKKAIRRWLSTNLIFQPSADGTSMTVSWPFVK